MRSVTAVYPYSLLPMGNPYSPYEYLLETVPVAGMKSLALVIIVLLVKRFSIIIIIK